MRLDKWLKTSRIIKRRSVANEACDKGKILINDRTAKASNIVKESDILIVSIGSKKTVLEILEVPDFHNVTTQYAKNLYKIISTEKIDI